MARKRNMKKEKRERNKRNANDYKKRKIQTGKRKFG